MAENLFEQDSMSVAERVAAEALIVDVDGFEGPLDLLLTLGRSQKVDLRKISVLQLARQYLAFVEKAAAKTAPRARNWPPIWPSSLSVLRPCVMPPPA